MDDGGVVEDGFGHGAVEGLLTEGDAAVGERCLESGDVGTPSRAKGRWYGSSREREAKVKGGTRGGVAMKLMGR